MIYRAPTKVTTIHSPSHSKEEIRLVLPELKHSSGTVFHSRIEIDGLSPKECCQQAIKDFHKTIRDEMGQNAIVPAEVEITIKSNYVPTCVFLDIPGLAPTSPFSEPDETSKKVLLDNLKQCKTKHVNALIVSPVKCSSVGIYVPVVSGVIGGGLTSENVCIVYTHVDKVRRTHLLCARHVSSLC